MKEKLSITVDAETVRKIEQTIQEGRFRNKSHIMEFAVAQLLKQTLEGIK